ncbi:hypothetical protein P7H60_06115 [Vagococcus carniphilus]|uniref:hypothetical protein n=1 Tax=Vagococcus carniphilus TaxID=218144 RepID=UPI0028912825|nr:hypothetical protein [Vagococcus carniphilus]MDT2813711.1 hypothetical protein [Vagococcus carniphilus]MDT2848731.1 hypothetical protein [Vagococcus carniphilus]
MKEKSTLTNVILLATATYFLKKWLMDEKDEKKKPKENKKENTLERKKEQLLELFS